MRLCSLVLTVSTALAPCLQASGQADHMAATKPKAKPSAELRLTGLSGTARTITPAALAAMPHVTVTVHNAHTNKDESYSGVPVDQLLMMVAPAKGEGPKVSANMQVVIAGATDGFHVALTLCDTDPACRTGKAIVADVQDTLPIEADGAFKLILTEDKRPARWVRNLDSLTVKAVSAD